MNSISESDRHIGLLGATGVGVGAIVGGGILALAGTALAATGPSAIVAFALNGVIALLTALSFAEMSSAFPQSGGTYTFAKKVLSVEAAFVVGWVVWFASIVAAVLYALGLGHFTAVAVGDIWSAIGGAVPSWVSGWSARVVLAIAATVLLATGLIRKAAGGGQWMNVGKVAVFAVLIAAGLWSLTGRAPRDVGASLTPFFSAGGLGLFQAMGYTFIALQGFDLIAAVAGEIREPRRTIPRAMFYSLAIALGIYLPLLFVITTVGIPSGESVTAVSKKSPETIVAIAARNYLGGFGYWLVIVAAILSMLSALQANLFAASRVAASMARDNTLPKKLSEISPRRRTPVWAILATTAIVVTILLVVPDVAAAGAASSLIFLITFALAHWISILVRRRSQSLVSSFRAPFFPVVPVTGAFACIALAMFQGIEVRSAGGIACAWLALGGVLFLSLFAQRARVVDASTEALDPEVSRLRGRNPLVLVPIANPANAGAMVAVANALAPREVGRVLLLSVVVAPKGWRSSDDPSRLADVQSVLGKSLAASLEAGVFPEALTTIAAEPWPEIVRVARLHRCESVLLGLTSLDGETISRRSTPLDQLMGAVDSDVVVLRAPHGWKLDPVSRILVPIGGRGGHHTLRARLLGSFSRTGDREVTYLRVLSTDTPQFEIDRAIREATRISEDETHGLATVKVVTSDDVIDVLVQNARQSDLVILGLQRLSRRKKTLGWLTQQVASQTTCPLIMISRRG